MEGEIKNKVASSGLITIDLETFLPKTELIGLDIKDQLFMGQILKEKEFREFIKSHNWAQYQSKNVYIYCSNDAIIPIWAYMLISIQLTPLAENFIVGSKKDLIQKILENKLSEMDFSPYKDARVVVKGCSKEAIPTDVYSELCKKLVPITKSIMFGEPCSTVPLYKKLNLA